MKTYTVVEYFRDKYGCTATYYVAFSTREEAKSWLDLHKTRDYTYYIWESIVDENEVENTEKPINKEED